MALDPKIDALLKMAKMSESPPIHEMDLKSARRILDSKYANRFDRNSVSSVDDRSIETGHGPITLRVYRPANIRGDGLVYVFYHGGGGVFYSIDAYDSLCGRISNVSGATVVSVGYHLAPEYRFPVQIEDAVTAYLWVVANCETLSVDPDRIVVMGDSFGAYLATEVCLESANRGYGCPYAQVLLYPRTDHCRTDLESYVAYSSGYDLDREEMDWFWNCYLPDRCDYDDPRICPNRCKDLSFMPPAFVYTAEYDPLRDEGEEYARKMADCGVPVRLVRVEGYIHGFIHMWDVLDRSGRILDEIALLFPEE